MTAYTDALTACNGETTTGPTPSSTTTGTTASICVSSSFFENSSPDSCLGFGQALYTGDLDATACEEGPELYVRYLKCIYECACDGVQICESEDNSVYGTISGRSDLSLFKEAIDGSGLASTLQVTSSSYTVLAPNNEAVEKLGDYDVSTLVSNHIIFSENTASSLVDGSTLFTFAGSSLPVSLNPTQIGGANVIEADLVGNNGIVHIIDTVLVPAGLEITQAPAVSGNAPAPTASSEEDPPAPTMAPSASTPDVDPMPPSQMGTPSMAPVPAPSMVSMETPTIVVTEANCTDSETWWKKGDPSKDCAWVANHPPRCDAKGNDRTFASYSCPAACGTPCLDAESEWYKNGDPSKDCTWVSVKPEKRCLVNDENKVKAREMCLTACADHLSAE